MGGRGRSSGHSTGNNQSGGASYHKPASFPVYGNSTKEVAESQISNLRQLLKGKGVK